MRVLTTTLSNAQKNLGVTGGVFDAIWKLVLSRAGQTTRGYDITRIMSIQHTEEEDNGIAEVLLDNSDGVLTSLNFELFQGILYYGYNTGVARSAWVANTVYAVGDIVIPTTPNNYQYRCVTAGTSHAATEPTWGTALGVQQSDGTVTWEMDGNTGDEYSPTAPVKVDGQEFISSQTQLVCRLYLIGLPNQMAQDKAESVYTQESADTNTVKTLFTAVSGATLAPYTNYDAVTVAYDSEDSIIDSFKPADYFSISVNESRDNKMKELLDLTGCKRRAEDDGQIHVFDPVVSGSSYDYEYRLDVSGYHTFFSKNLRNRFVNPNKVIVQSHPDHETQYSGSATSATSYALSPKTLTVQRRLASNAQAAAIASAIIERGELSAERGGAVVPMNCGQEVFDYIQVTDSSQGDTRTGNVQYIQRRCQISTDRSEGAFEMTIRFGRINNQSLSYEQFGADTSFQAGGAGLGVPSWVEEMLWQHTLDIRALFENQNAILDFLNQGVVPKWHVTQQMIIPVVT